VHDYRICLSKFISAAKAAAIHTTRWVALELADYRIRVNAISPIGIVTPVFAQIFGLEGEEAVAANATVRAWLAKGNPTGRAGEPDDIAGAAIFLASDEALLINGHNLVVDGGATVGRTIQDTLRRFGELTAAMGVEGPKATKGETPV
jgi:NAD(P)-dependent dehydrogenase (short-subunit alcohol dehydrogenase family)